MPNNIYSVKQAAKILGLSTNTTYKYLNEGRIKAARGHIRGTFIITAKALEDFLGSKIPTDTLDEAAGTSSFGSPNSDAEAVIEVSPPTLATKIVRLLIVFCLLLIIADLFLAPRFSPVTQISRLFLIFIFVLVSYQFGGFTKK